MFASRGNDSPFARHLPTPLLSKWSGSKNKWAVTKSASLDTVKGTIPSVRPSLFHHPLIFPTKRWILSLFVFVDVKAFLCFTSFSTAFLFYSWSWLLHAHAFLYTVYVYVHAGVYVRGSNPVFIAVTHQRLMSCAASLWIMRAYLCVCAQSCCNGLLVGSMAPR